MHWLEGSFLTVIQLAKHGGGANVFGSIAKMLPFVLRVQECPDREFALVAKRTLTYLKYLVFPRRHLAAAGGHAGDPPQWHRGSGPAPAPTATKPANYGGAEGRTADARRAATSRGTPSWIPEGRRDGERRRCGVRARCPPP